MASPFDACRRCVDRCPTGAIALDQRGIAVAGDRCVGCGRCAAVCPTEAIDVPGFAAIPPGPIECARVAPSDRRPGAAVVPCLGGLRATDFLGHGSLPVDRGWCAGCSAGGVDMPWAAAAADADAVRQWLGREPVRVERQSLPVRRALPLPEHLDAKGAGRRRLFPRGTARPPAVSVAVRRLEPVATLRRAAMIERLSGLPAPGVVLPGLTVGDACDANRVCVAACPTTALGVVTDASGTGLDFDPTRCTACGVCAVACPERAITIAARGTDEAAWPVALTRDPARSCLDCGQTFVPRNGALVCPVCANAREVAGLGFDLMRGPRHDSPSPDATGGTPRAIT